MRQLHPLGPLSQDENVPQWWTSHPVPVPLFEDELFPFTIADDTGDSDSDSEGDYPPDVAGAVNAFLSLGVADRAAAGERIFASYQAFLATAGPGERAIDIPDANSVWRHVRPIHVYVARRRGRDKGIYVRVACECDWEAEHGLQLVYRGGAELVRVSNQDGHFSDADEHDLPDDAADQRAAPNKR